MVLEVDKHDRQNIQRTLIQNTLEEIMRIRAFDLYST